MLILDSIKRESIKVKLVKTKRKNKPIGVFI